MRRLQDRSSRLLATIAFALGFGAAAACSAHTGPSVHRSAPRPRAAALVARQAAADLSPSPPQQPSDPVLVDAEQPDLRPAAGPLAATAIATPGDSAASFPSQKSLNLPPGFQVSVYAIVNGGPRFMAFSPDGHLFVSLMTAGRVAELQDDGSGSDAHPTVVVDGLNSPHSLAFHDGYMYVGETHEVVRFPYRDGQVQAGSREVVVPNLPQGGHVTRTVEFGPDGNMYLAVGSSCNVCLESNPLRAAITVFAPDGSSRPFATGLRNAVGFVFQPGTGDLWATVNGRDDIGQDMGLTGAAATAVTDNTPPDYVTRVTDGGSYGWPRCYGDHQLDPKFGDAAFCAASLAPSVELQAHSAPLGLAFYSGTAFPAAYQGDLFVALHGSWDRTTRTGYKLVRVHFQDGKPVSAEDFATGWLSGDSVWGRPVGVLAGPDGSLFVSDDAGRIYRITYSGGSYPNSL